MNFLKAVSKFIKQANAPIDTLNKAIDDLTQLYEEARQVALQVEMLEAPDVVLPAKVARHFHHVLDRDFMTIRFPDDMDKKLFNKMKEKIKLWDPIPTEPDKSSVIKDTLNAILTKKYIEQKQSKSAHFVKERKAWRDQFVKDLELCFNDPTKMAEAINTRQALSKNKMAYSEFTSDELPRALLAIKTRDTSIYTIHDMVRIRAELSSSGFSTAEIKAMTESDPAEVVTLASVIFYTQADNPDTNKPEQHHNAYMTLALANDGALMDEVQEDKLLFEASLYILAKSSIEYQRAQKTLQENIANQLQQIEQQKENPILKEYIAWLEKQIPAAMAVLEAAAPNPVKCGISKDALYEQTNILTKANRDLNAVILVSQYMQARALFSENHKNKKIRKEIKPFAISTGELIDQHIPKTWDELLRAIKNGALKSSLLQELTVRVNAINATVDDPIQTHVVGQDKLRTFNDYFNTRLNFSQAGQTTPQIEALLKETEQLRKLTTNSTVMFPLVEFTNYISKLQTNQGDAALLADWQNLLALTQYKEVHKSLTETINNLPRGNPHRVHSTSILRLTEALNERTSPTTNELASASHVLSTVDAVIKTPSSETIAALAQATTEASSNSELRDPLIRTQYCHAKTTLESLLESNSGQPPNIDLKLAGRDMLNHARDIVGPDTSLTPLDTVEDALNSLKAVINVINDSSETNNTALQSATELMHYLSEKTKLKRTIERIPTTMPLYKKIRANLEVELQSIEKRQETNPPLSNLINELKKLNEIARLEMGYKEIRAQLEEQIKDLKRTPPKSILISYGQEILKLTKLRVSSEFGDVELPEGMRLHELSLTLETANKAIEACSSSNSNPTILTTFAMSCTRLGAQLAPPETKISTGKKIAGILLGIAGVLLIAASVAVAVVTYGFATPLSMAGISLALTFIAAGAAMGTVGLVSGIGLFRERKPHAMKIKESLDKLAKVATDKADAGTDPARQAPSKPEEEEPSSQNDGPVYGDL